MELLFLGTGSAFTLKNYQTNVIVSQHGKKLLIDAGMDIRWSLKEQNLSYKDIDSLYITHQHADHIGGVEYLAFTTYFDPSCKQKIQLFGNNKLIRQTWNNSLKGGLESKQCQVLNLEDYFDVNMIRDNGKFIWEGITFQIVQSVHIFNGYSIVPTYGLLITDPATNKKIYYTGDSQFCPNQIIDFYNEADIIIQDCETNYKSGVHAHFDDLCTLNESIKKKMWLVHYQDNVVDDLAKWQQKAYDNDFICGFVEKGLTLEIE